MSDEIKNQFSGLPIRDLIAGPLIASAEAQMKLAETSLQFIDRIGFDQKKARLLEFTLERPVLNSGSDGKQSVGKQSINVKAPLLGLVPTPALLIEDVSVDFQMEVSTATQTKEQTQAEATLKAKAGSWFYGVEFEDKVSSSRENTRSTNQTAKYNIRVNARQQRPTEGMSKLMDIMASCIAPIETK